MPNGLFNLKQHLSAIQQSAWTGQKTPAVNYLVVAGGGGASAGGGGAGGLLQGNLPVTTGSAITVTIGSGGTSQTGSGLQGNNSVFGNIIATGGGGGGWRGNSAPSYGTGGSGGGSGADGYSVGGQGTAVQGNAGGNNPGAYSRGGGGGGAGTVGVNAFSSTADTPGGLGVASDISGTRSVYAAGGAASTTAASGTANTGNGGVGSYSTPSGTGGSGIVILSYPDTYAAATSTTGSPTVSTSGSGSIAFTGSTSVYTNVTTNSSNFAFSTGDFTIEFWVYTNSAGTYTVYDSRALGVNDLSPTLYLNSNVITFYTNASDRITGGSVTNATWTHIALVRISGSTKLYLNGTQTGSTYTDSNNYINSSNRPYIGGGSIVVGQNPLNGYMTNVRVVKGVGVYTGTFTPSTAPLQATQSAGTNIAAITGSSTSLLLNAVSGAYLADSSTLANTMGVSTAPAWNSSSPFATGLGYKNRVYTWTSSGSITF